MKDQLLLLAKYNYFTDKEVVRILSKIDDAERMQDRRSFAVSLHGLLDHNFEAVLYFQKQLKKSFPGVKCFDHGYIDYETVYNQISLNDFNELKNALDIIDNAFVEFITSISEDDLNRLISVDSFSGIEKQFVWFVLIQCFTHATHHRGEISQILDEMGIENDYSGMKCSYD